MSEEGLRSTDTADLVILGGGSGGYACALRAAELGLSVVLVEKDKLGGTCLHRGCVPTKALLHAAEVADHARDGGKVGIRSTFDGVDMAGVNSYKDGVVSRLHKGLQGLVASRGITVVEGAGTLEGPGVVRVGDERWTGRNVVLATGSYARSLPGLELDDRIVTSDAAISLDDVPQRVVVLGGGVIGVEFASVWRSFGAEVTVVEALPRLVPGEDEFASTQLARAFRRRRITARTGVRFSKATRQGDTVTVSLESGEEIEADLLLVAVGRGPNTTGHGFAEAGVAMDGGFVTVDERLRTNLDGVFAVGDVTPGLQLAHRGFAHGIFVAEEVAGLSPVPVTDDGIPRVTYCDPEIASVGLTEADARDRYGEVHTLTYDLAGNGKSQILQTSGAIKLVQAGPSGADGPVVGVRMVGSRVGELVGEAQLIYNWEALPADVAALIHAHPTQSEALGEAHLALAGKPLHTHG
ncbi:Dihydrolipoamide dehydrogenase of branched-chain alpha-keto acid dehydrogenase [Pseudonocardia sp. Ae168_Ps1]|uniref:dihydrolipoyl dehydrogenase n=1 Tax=unclassified Pseudonocardia TaxID=2619320 RepID=UPI000969E96E|nr:MULTISPECIES: dihydrolipoyl dehydrogenase [unclassified Pseudonocardia]OLL72942.1 Dihydrolipoamide dehydrogenase of branched-chain alpha-keto acid dehydrogenase [Pseudonocardia sp. Ae150A_Ps1]OLL78918.1 Dihydrolipoamide dehydrogenase of branched-chain alpha-keto acid dehydrogenase [Pseudonocardia sp. Ae168_Ps1]OLL86944.1 Dihydrolipoamide dehydrogenase of branched-chain alpha-keto acid dehydrogenase [Pseudonocardia sp. Ae263_Ps1]OLL93011.1 Dihydrolipoamide dehydrogenase of branched-chain alph